MVKIPLLTIGIVCILIGAAASFASGFVLSQFDRPGLGLVGLGIFDILLFYSFTMIGLQVWGLGAISGRLQFVLALFSGITGVFGGLALVLAAIAALTIMVALLLAIPFGTLTYLALFGHFDTAAARIILSLLLTVKLGGLALIVLAAPGILKNTTLVLMSAVSVLFTFGLGFVHALVPNFLVSIADTICAIVFGIVAAIWMLLLVLSGLGSLIRVIRGIVPA